MSTKKRRAPVRNNLEAWGRVLKNVSPTDDSYKEFMGDYGDSPVFRKAVETVDGRDKQEHYGPPEESMRRIGLIWSGILGVEISPEKVALMMLGLKAARLSIDPRHVDSLVDAGGYVRILERLAK